MAELDVGNFDLSFGWHPPDEKLNEAMDFLREIVESEELEGQGVKGIELKGHSAAHKDMLKTLEIDLFEEIEGGNEEFASCVRRAVEGMLRVYCEEYRNTKEEEEGKLFHAIARDPSNRHAIAFITGYLRRNGTTALITDFALRKDQAIDVLYRIHGLAEMELGYEERQAIETTINPNHPLYDQLTREDLGYVAENDDPSHLRLELARLN